MGGLVVSKWRKKRRPQIRNDGAGGEWRERGEGRGTPCKTSDVEGEAEGKGRARRLALKQSEIALRSRLRTGRNVSDGADKRCKILSQKTRRISAAGETPLKP